ncbi:MAG: GNAT family N-acetyltransferase [Candidatus Parcubacteria bacterium]|nr:GNAT family N-acetyltransferase [Candidatus Parcubacteria bacterium]
MSEQINLSKGKEKKETILIPEQQVIKNYINEVLVADNKLDLPVVIISSPEAQEIVKQKLITCFKNNNINDAIKINDTFKLPKEIIQEAVKQGIIYHLRGHYIYNAFEISNAFNLPPKIVQEVTKQALINYFEYGYIESAIEITEIFNLPDEIIFSLEVQQAAAQPFISKFKYGSLDDAIKINDTFKLPKEIIQETAKQAFIVWFCNHRIDDVIYDISIAQYAFNLPKTIAQDAPKQGYIECLKSGLIDAAIEIKDICKLSLSKEIISDPEVQKGIEEGFINYLHNNQIDIAIKIKDEFNLPDEIVQKAVEQVVIKHLREHQVNIAIKIKDKFNLYISPQKIIDQIPKLVDIIEQISQLAPPFKMQTEKSSELVIGLCRFINKPDYLINLLKEKLYLIDAIMSNPRFGSRLLLKYPEFDEMSKENIEKLFLTKQKILEQNPDIDPESLEFRQLMQEELKTFKNNPEIMEEIEKQGINLEEWLNHSETSYFNLSSKGSEISFSEKIRTPIDRIKETIDSYAHTIKSVLKEYILELKKHEIALENDESVKEQITKMEGALEQAQAEGNDTKIKGIERGLLTQRERLNNPKKGILWDKLMGDIEAFQGLKNDCFDAQKKLIEAEDKLTGALAGKAPSGKGVLEIKQKIAQAKEELRNKFNVLERRIENFKINLPKLLSPCLGQERSEALIQEIDQAVAEQFYHFELDRTVLANMFSERNDKETEQLESRPMSIFVWARNPDIDLYQGDYSPCCICIDSYDATESTIADYNTDLGIQIVNIWDEAKNEPVTAAWCWLGQNENGEKALVIDNIESNVLFSTNFSEQLSKELLDYIINYAKKIGVDKVILGVDYSDLPSASKLLELKWDNNEYEKIGGSNREYGYYLESEGDIIKLIWDRKEDETIKQPKEARKQKETIKFENISVTNLTEENFDEIRQLEAKIYQDTGLAQGSGLIENIKSDNGLEYSLIIRGKQPDQEEKIIGYIVAVDDETDEGDPCIYLEDIAVLDEAQGQGLGWEMLKELVNKLKIKAQKNKKPILLDMHLRKNSQGLLQKHKEDLEEMGVRLTEEALEPNYYDTNEDALYQIYQIQID